MSEKQIGLRMSKLRESQGLTTTALAKRVGISQAQISRLENGKQGFRSSTLARIAEALGVRPVYFYLDESQTEASLAREDVMAYSAPGDIGKALQDPEFRDLVGAAARAFLHNHEAFRVIADAIRSVPQSWREVAPSIRPSRRRPS